MTGQNEKPLMLALGATGGVGGVIADAMLKRGWAVRGLARDRAKAAKGSNGAAIDWVEGDAMDADAVRAAARGAAVILHAVNPPGYQNWEKLVLPMIDSSIAAARASGATIVLPGTIYNYDPAISMVIDENTPQTARSRKGQVRIAMEKHLREAAPEVRSIILRAGDFFGPGVRSSWFAQAMVKAGRPVTSISHPGKEVPHSWAYLPDLAEALAWAIEARGRMAPFETMQFEGFVDVDGRQMAEAIAEAAGRKVAVNAFPWWVMRLAAPFGGFPREVMEIRPFWRHPVRLDNARLTELIGPEPRTPIVEAVRAALKGLDAL